MIGVKTYIIVFIFVAGSLSLIKAQYETGSRSHRHGQPKFHPRCYISKTFERYCGLYRTKSGVSLKTCLRICERVSTCYVANWFPNRHRCVYFLRTKRNRACQRRRGQYFNRRARTIRCYLNANTLSDCKIPLKDEDTNCGNKGSLKSFRTFDGSCNNLKYPSQGAANTPPTRMLPAKYHDEAGLDTPYGFSTLPVHKTYPTAQQVSNGVFAKGSKREEGNNRLSTLHMTLGQFYDHDVALLENSKQCNQIRSCRKRTLLESFKYPCMPILTQRNRRGDCVGFTRSFPACQTGKRRGTREQINEPTGYVDLSQVYGSSEREAEELRTHRDGLLKTSRKNLLPADPKSQLPCQGRAGGCYFAGDGRVNENFPLATMHTLFVREHNRIARQLQRLNPHWNDERLFQEARKISIGQYQHILYNEWVPTVVKLGRYPGYDPHTNAQIDNDFQTAAFRFAHSQIPNSFSQLNNNFDEVTPNVALQLAFRNNSLLYHNGIEQTMFGLVGNNSNTVDSRFSEGIFQRLFVDFGTRGFRNLAAINIQRGRDHGLPSYQEYRKHCGLSVPRGFTGFHEIRLGDRKRLQRTYTSVRNHIDLFAAGILERHVYGSQVGPTFHCIIKKHFEEVRKGDRYFYQNPGVFSWDQLATIHRASMARLLCDNLQNAVSIQKDVFKEFDPRYNKRRSCHYLPKVDLSRWKE